MLGFQPFSQTRRAVCAKKILIIILAKGAYVCACAILKQHARFLLSQIANSNQFHDLTDMNGAAINRIANTCNE